MQHPITEENLNDLLRHVTGIDRRVMGGKTPDTVRTQWGQALAPFFAAQPDLAISVEWVNAAVSRWYAETATGQPITPADVLGFLRAELRADAAWQRTRKFLAEGQESAKDVADESTRQAAIAQMRAKLAKLRANKALGSTC